MHACMHVYDNLHHMYVFAFFGKYFKFKHIYYLVIMFIYV